MLVLVQTVRINAINRIVSSNGVTPITMEPPWKPTPSLSRMTALDNGTVCADSTLLPSSMAATSNTSAVINPNGTA